jgi:hypothetical protein
VLASRALIGGGEAEMEHHRREEKRREEKRRDRKSKGE